RDAHDADPGPPGPRNVDDFREAPENGSLAGLGGGGCSLPEPVSGTPIPANRRKNRGNRRKSRLQTTGNPIYPCAVSRLALNGFKRITGACFWVTGQECK